MVTAGQTTAFWLTLAVPADAEPGNYSSAATVFTATASQGAGADVHVPIDVQVQVWDLKLPPMSKSSFHNFFQFQFQPHPFGAKGAKIRGVLDPYYGSRTPQVGLSERAG